LLAGRDIAPKPAKIKGFGRYLNDRPWMASRVRRALLLEAVLNPAQQ
jgi:hypothetical protein